MTGAVADTLADAPRECVNVALRDRRDRDTVKKVGVAVGDAVTEQLADGLSDADDVTVYGDADAVGDSDRLGDSEMLSDRVAKLLAVGATLLLREVVPLRDVLRVVEGKTLGDTVADAATDGDVDTVKGDAETLTDPLIDGEVVRVADAVGDTVAVGVRVTVAEKLAVREGVAETDSDTERDRVAATDDVAVGEPLPLGDSDDEAVDDREPVAVNDGDVVGAAVGDLDTLALALTVAVAAALAVSERLDDTLQLADGDALALAVGEGDAVAEPVAECVADNDGDGVEERERERELEPENDTEADRDGDTLGVVLGEEVAVVDAVSDRLTDTDSVALCDIDGNVVSDAVTLLLRVGICVGEPLDVTLALTDAERDALRDAVGEAVCDGVAVPVVLDDGTIVATTLGELETDGDGGVLAVCEIEALEATLVKAEGVTDVVGVGLMLPLTSQVSNSRTNMPVGPEKPLPMVIGVPVPPGTFLIALLLKSACKRRRSPSQRRREGQKIRCRW